MSARAFRAATGLIPTAAFGIAIPVAHKLTGGNLVTTTILAMATVMIGFLACSAASKIEAHPGMMAVTMTIATLITAPFMALTAGIIWLFTN